MSTWSFQLFPKMVTTGVPASKLMEVQRVLAEAAKAKAGGAQRFCMGAAWRDLKDRDLPKVSAMIAGVKAMGMETCVTLGMLEPHQAVALKEAGLDYYNHNLDTGPACCTPWPPCPITPTACRSMI